MIASYVPSSPLGFHGGSLASNQHLITLTESAKTAIAEAIRRIGFEDDILAQEALIPGYAWLIAELRARGVSAIHERSRTQAFTALLKFLDLTLAAINT